MLNNRGNKFDEGQEESEYHFSDDESNYEFDAETTDVEENVSEEKTNLLNRLKESKKLFIGIGVFLVLLFIFYKIVSPPSTPTPSDVITPVSQQPKAAIQGSAPTPAATTPAAMVPPPIPGSAQQPAPQITQEATAPPVPVTQPAPTAVQPSIFQSSNEPTQTTTQPYSPPQQVSSSNQAPMQTSEQQPPAFQPPSAAQPQVTSMPSQQLGVLQQQQLPQVSTTVAPPQQAVGDRPVISPPPSVISIPAPDQSVIYGSSTTDAKIANLEANNQKLINQLQADYIQRLNDFYNQNRQLQDQLQSLSGRVSTIETQLNQLIQALTRQQSQAGAGSEVTSPPPGPQSQATPKIPYNVQAIIPGRAWLRSENGETLTVAEGDPVGDAGRVTKIDPYDGVVEISTAQGKTVSLSYGNIG